MHGLLGGSAVAGPQAASQIAYHIDEDTADSGSEGGSPTRQSLLQHNLSRFSGSSSGSGAPLFSGPGGVGSSTVGRPSLLAPGLNRAASSSSPGSDVQGPRSKSCSAAGSTRQQQQQGGEGSGPEGLRHTSGFQRSKNRWKSAAANVMQMKKVRGAAAAVAATRGRQERACIISYAVMSRSRTAAATAMQATALAPAEEAAAAPNSQMLAPVGGPRGRNLHRLQAAADIRMTHPHASCQFMPS
jgi:hypothetical protein